MRQVLVFLLCSFILVIVETTFTLPYLHAGLPELHYLLVMYLSLQGTLLVGLAVLLPLVLQLDAVSGVLPGYHAAFCGISYLTVRLMVQRHHWLRVSSLRLPLLGLNYLLLSGLMYLVLDFFKPAMMGTWSWPSMLLQAVVLTVLATPFFRAFHWIEHQTLRASFGFKIFRNDNRKRRQV